MDQKPRLNNIASWLIVALLVLILTTQIFIIFSTYQQNKVASERAATYQARVEEAQKLVDDQRDLIIGLIVDYQSDVYDNPAVDRIAEQQLIATEYQLIALQTLALQNSQIIELIATAP